MAARQYKIDLKLPGFDAEKLDTLATLMGKSRREVIRTLIHRKWRAEKKRAGDHHRGDNG